MSAHIYCPAVSPIDACLHSTAFASFFVDLRFDWQWNGMIMLSSLFNYHRIVFFLTICLTLVFSYEWESWDYYQMLGLDDPSANTTEVKQAYRRQAKAWHPDKQHHTSNDDDVTKEEATARFRRIAEAYQVLSDPEQRHRYDAYLQQEQRLKAASAYQTMSTNSPSAVQEDSGSFFSWQTFKDPFKVFEDFFFSQDDDDDGDFSWMNGEATDPFVGEASTMQEESYYMHPQYGEVLRVTQHEHNIWTGEFRMLYQDFVEDWDPYRGNWAWFPISQPTVVRPQAVLQGRLVPPEVLVQGPFVAGIRDCQIQIRRGASIIWRVPPGDENTFFHRQYQQCYMAMHGSQLALHMNGRVRWSTPMAPEDAEWRQSLSGQRLSRYPRYEARLDTDGSLTIYRKTSPKVNGVTDKLSAWLWKDPKCFYSSNPAGCHRLGRLIVRVITLNRRLDGVLFHRITELFSRVLDWMEGNDDDEHYFPWNLCLGITEYRQDFPSRKRIFEPLCTDASW